jgi:hypothetical protein
VEDSETPVVEDKILGKFDDVDSLAKSYQELQSRMGNSVRIPNADSSAEEVSLFYQKMGMPESPEGYTVGEGMEEMLEGFKPMAHSANLTQRQFDHFAKAQGEAADAAEVAPVLPMVYFYEHTAIGSAIIFVYVLERIWRFQATRAGFN